VSEPDKKLENSSIFYTSDKIKKEQTNGLCRYIDSIKREEGAEAKHTEVEAKIE